MNIVGIDEAGRGPLAGVVSACALYLKKEPPFIPRDSKKLSAKVRNEMFGWLTDSDNTDFCLAIATPTEIDKLNILEATFLTFNRAITGLIEKAPYLKDAEFIIDGNLFRTNLKINYRCQEKADQTVKQVSCASIVAKVSRDYLMDVADFLYPDWGFAQHKGYPTAEHRAKASRDVLTPLHRRSFSPCRFEESTENGVRSTEGNE